MRTIIVLAASMMALTACHRPVDRTPAPGPPGLSLSRPPVRKAGFWEQTLTRDGVAPGLSLMGKVRLCVDAASQAKLSLFGDRLGKGSCRGRSLSRGPDGLVSFAATCDMGIAGVATSTGTLSGDLASAYRLHVESDVAGASLAALNGRHVTDIAATRLGPCPAGLVPGDVLLANGMKINVDKIGAAATAVSGGG